MPATKHVLAWLEPGSPFPPAHCAWDAQSEAPGLLAAGGDLSPDTLHRAYANGIFPWFCAGQPILWWSPAPRMVLEVVNFRLHRSLRKTLLHFQNNAQCEIRFDSAFTQVIHACSTVSRHGQPGTWILPAMVQAYTRLHELGLVHSVETWINGELVGGLYCVALGRAVFGESMFAKTSDASKIALAALIAFARENSIELIDCQQNTTHLASLGAAEISRPLFLEKIQAARNGPSLDWRFDPLYWRNLMSA